MLFRGNVAGGSRSVEFGRRVTWWMRRRCTVPSHCPSLLAICANCRFFRMPCWCLAHSHPHPGSLHDNDRGCFQCPQFGHRTCDGGLTWGFPPDPAPPPSPSPIDAVARRSIDARPTVGRDGALARSPAFNTCWTKFGPSEGPRPKVGDSAALASSCARSVRSVRLRSLLVRARRIDRPDARAKGRETNLSMGVVAMSQGARPSPRSPAPLPPRSRHRRRRPETKGGMASLSRPDAIPLTEHR